MLTPLALRDVPDSLLEPVQRFRRNRALDVRTSRKAEPEELPFLRSCHRTLRLIHLEFELLCDEARDALHHPLTRAFAANVDITVIRVANKAMSPALQLAVEFVEHEVHCIRPSNCSADKQARCQATLRPAIRKSKSELEEA